MIIKILLVSFILSIFAYTNNAVGLPPKETNQENSLRFIDLSSGKVTDIVPVTSVLLKNSDNIITSSLPFNSETYLKCANIFMQNVTWSSAWPGYNCDNAIYFLNSEERLTYVNKNVIDNSNRNNTVIPTSRKDSLINISTMSEGDSEDSTIIAIRSTDKDGEYVTLYIPETERFVIDIDYRISIYNKKNGKLIRKGYIQDLTYK